MSAKYVLNTVWNGPNEEEADNGFAWVLGSPQESPALHEKKENKYSNEENVRKRKKM